MARPRAKLDRCGEADLVTRRLNTEPPGARRERLLAVQLGLRGELGLDRIAQAVGTPLTDRLPSPQSSGEPTGARQEAPRIIQGKSRAARSLSAPEPDVPCRSSRRGQTKISVVDPDLHVGGTWAARWNLGVAAGHSISSCLRSLPSIPLCHRAPGTMQWG